MDSRSLSPQTQTIHREDEGTGGVFYMTVLESRALEQHCSVNCIRQQRQVNALPSLWNCLQVLCYTNESRCNAIYRLKRTCMNARSMRRR